MLMTLVVIAVAGLALVWAGLRGRRLYWDNHFERQAREACAESHA